MTEPLHRLVLWLLAVLISLPLILKGHITSGTRGDVAFLPDGTSRSGGITIRVSGHIVIPGVYHLPSSINLENVTILTDDPSRKLTIDRTSVHPAIHNGDAVVLSGKDAKHITITKKMMSNKEKVILGIPLDLNTVNIEDLVALPGIGEATAENIVQYRQKYGGFSTIQDLKRVPGLSEKKVKQIEQYF